MKFYLKYTIVVFVLFFSCTEESEKALPDYLIEREKMVEIISEIELTQALIKLKFTTQDTINSQELYNQVYEGFEITEVQFNKSLEYYCKKPKGTESLYIDAIERLSERQVNVD
ncbi:DUF4296 domain-containing protein [Vicingaceae bacterium]|nr:DUF4296 domain-containing protein [Vicingaceae bacterium]